jgi:hypothetical protein
MTESRLRFPAIFIGLILVALLCGFTPFNNILLQNSPLAGGHFPLVSFACFLLLIAVVNPLLSLIGDRYRFHVHEILLIWSMLTVATGLAYTGLLRTFIINITTPAWFTTTASDLGPLLLPLLPSALFPQDAEMVRTVYNGLVGGRDMTWWEVLSHIPWNAWLLPLLLWALFVGLVYTVMMGMVGIFSHQWIENEKMNFPLLRVPQILCEEVEKRTLWKYFTHKYFLIGISIPLLLHLFNGLHTYFPEVPQIPNVLLLRPYIPKEGFFSGFLKLKYYIYPAFIGFSFLTSSQVSFSLWFFYIVGGYLPGFLQVLGWRLPTAAMGTTFGPVLSQVEEMQMIGAFGVFFFFILWLARQHLWMIVQSLFGKKVFAGREMHGFMSPRTAAFLFLGGLTGIVLWLRLFGMDLLSVLAFLGICFMLQLVSSRLICQGGLPYFTLTAAPSDGFLAFLDTRLLVPAALYLGLVVQKVTFVDMRESLMPSVFHAAKLSDGCHPRHRFLWSIIGAIGLGVAVSFVAMLALYYKFGISFLPDEWALEGARRVHENVAQIIKHPEELKKWSVIFTAIGGLVMLFLTWGYHRFLWWPLHPIGYLTTYSSALQILWFSFFIGWLCNMLVLRYGGVNQFREVRRLFVGLVVGDMLMAIIWLIVGIFAQFSYHVLPL